MIQLQPGSVLQDGKYKIISVLGQGGFGITYLAEHSLLGKKVAIKEFFYKDYCNRDESTSHITVGTQSNTELVERFLKKFVKEAQTISQLHHPNIVEIYDIFSEKTNFLRYFNFMFL
jgi:serine/threonine protein kinase